MDSVPTPPENVFDFPPRLRTEFSLQLCKHQMAHSDDLSVHYSHSTFCKTWDTVFHKTGDFAFLDLMYNLSFRSNHTFKHFHGC